jgi:hypothetical protein
MASTMQQNGTIASIGLAASMSLNTTVAPFILRGASLLGIDSGYTAMPLRRKVWERLAGDMRPAPPGGMTRTVKLDDLPPVFDDRSSRARRTAASWSIAPAEAMSETAASALPRVLIVDDSRMVRATIIKHIKGRFDVREDGTGRRAGRP